MRRVPAGTVQAVGREAILCAGGGSACRPAARFLGGRACAGSVNRREEDGEAAGAERVLAAVHANG